MAKKALTHAFVTSVGRLDKGNFFKKMRYADLLKQTRNVNFNAGLPDSVLKTAHDLFIKNDSLATVGMKVGANLLLQGVTSNSVFHTQEHLPMVVTTTSNGSKSTSRNYKAHFHIGYPNISLKRYLNSPDYKIVKKNLYDTEQDVFDLDRKSLVSKSGFCQKQFIFLKKTYITPKIVEDLYTTAFGMLDLELSRYNFAVQKAILSDKRADLPKLDSTRLYGGLHRIKNSIIVSNQFPFYKLAVRVHLVQLTNPKLTLQALLTKVFHQKLTISEAAKGESYSNRIPLKKQLTQLDCSCNQASVQVNTHLDVRLEDSLFFKYNAKIIKTVTRALNPGDNFSLSITEYFGKSIDLTSLYESLNNNFVDLESPLNTVLCLELVGDSRACVEHVKDADIMHLGTSPTRVLVQSKLELSFVTEHSMDDEEEPLLYRQKNSTENKDDLLDVFSKSVEDYFHSSRATERMNIDFENIILGPQVNSSKKANNKKYRLLYDPLLLDQTNSLIDAVNSLKSNFKNEDTSNLTPDDTVFHNTTELEEQENMETSVDDIQDRILDLDEDEEDL